jgi:hypothetical protein
MPLEYLRHFWGSIKNRGEEDDYLRKETKADYRLVEKITRKLFGTSMCRDVPSITLPM